MSAMVRLESRVWSPGRNCSVMFEVLKYLESFCTYSERMKQGSSSHGVVEFGLKVKMVPVRMVLVEGRASTMTARTRVSMLWWEIIMLSVGLVGRWEHL